MKKPVFVKAIVISFFGLLVGMSMYFDDLKKSALGKDEYLKSQSARFDHFLLHPRLSMDIIGAFILAIFLFGLYELVCYFMFKIAGNTHGSRSLPENRYIE